MEINDTWTNYQTSSSCLASLASSPLFSWWLSPGRDWWLSPGRESLPDGAGGSLGKRLEEQLDKGGHSQNLFFWASQLEQGWQWGNNWRLLGRREGKRTMGTDCPAMFSIGDTYKHVKFLLDHIHWLEKTISSVTITPWLERQPSRLNVVKAWAELFHIENQNARKQFLKMGHNHGQTCNFRGKLLSSSWGICFDSQMLGSPNDMGRIFSAMHTTIAALSNSHSPPSLAEDLKGVAHIS